VTSPEFDAFQEALLKKVVVMKDTKGLEYAHSKDRFANFNRLAEGLKLPNTQIAWVYAMKHKDSIESYLRGEYKGTEPIRGRVVDLITYLTLIAGMIEEQENKTDLKEDNRLDQPFVCRNGIPLKDANSGKQQPFEYDPTPSKIGSIDLCTKCNNSLNLCKWAEIKITDTGLAHITCPKDKL
jgi:hypothetical protein